MTGYKRPSTTVGLSLNQAATCRAGRRWHLNTILPLTRILETELSEKLEAEIGLGFHGRFAHDLTGRARAFQSMVGGGMDVAKAASCLA